MTPAADDSLPTGDDPRPDGPHSRPTDHGAPDSADEAQPKRQVSDVRVPDESESRPDSMPPVEPEPEPDDEPADGEPGSGSIVLEVEDDPEQSNENPEPEPEPESESEPEPEQEPEPAASRGGTDDHDAGEVVISRGVSSVSSRRLAVVASGTEADSDGPGTADSGEGQISSGISSRRTAVADIHTAADDEERISSGISDRMTSVQPEPTHEPAEEKITNGISDRMAAVRPDADPPGGKGEASDVEIPTVTASHRPTSSIAESVAALTGGPPVDYDEEAAADEPENPEDDDSEEDEDADQPAAGEVEARESPTDESEEDEYEEEGEDEYGDEEDDEDHEEGDEAESTSDDESASASRSATHTVPPPDEWIDLPDPLLDLLDLPANARFSEYILRRELGHGSMSRVMLGTHIHAGTSAAIKMLDPRAVVKHPELVERFEREARAIRKLDHPGIVRIFEIDRYHGVHYIAMERIQGRNLQHLLGREEQRLFAPVLAARITRKVADALRYGYEHGVVHRDVKLDNIMVNEDKDVKVLDFGLALDTSRGPDEPRLTAEMSVLGSPNYISPEQARGQQVDFRTDMYSLGVCFYYMVTGRFPFIARDTIALIRKHVFDEPRQPSRINPQVPADIEAVVLRMMEKDRDNRYSSWQALIDELGRITGDVTEPAPHDDPDDGADADSGRRFTSSQIIALSDGEAEEILAMDALDTANISGEAVLPSDLEIMVQSGEGSVPAVVDELPPSAPPIAGSRPGRLPPSEDESIRAPRVVEGQRPKRVPRGTGRAPARRSERSAGDAPARSSDRLQPPPGSPASRSQRDASGSSSNVPPPPARRTQRTRGGNARKSGRIRDDGKAPARKSGRGIGGTPPVRQAGQIRGNPPPRQRADGSGSASDLPARQSDRIERDRDRDRERDDDAPQGPRMPNPRRRRRRSRR